MRSLQVDHSEVLCKEGHPEVLEGEGRSAHHEGAPKVPLGGTREVRNKDDPEVKWEDTREVLADADHVLHGLNSVSPGVNVIKLFSFITDDEAQ